MQPQPIFTAPAPLPRGPHSLSREEVRASHRMRLMVAVTQIVAERGYAKATITATARLAGVSPNVFYEQFDDIESCYLAAYEVFADALLAAVAASLAAAQTLDEVIESTLGAYLTMLDAEPVLTRAFLIEIDAVGATARERRRTAYAQFATLLKGAHSGWNASDPAFVPLPDSAYLGLVHGIRALVCDAIERGSPAPLTGLVPDLLRWLRVSFGAG